MILYRLPVLYLYPCFFQHKRLKETVKTTATTLYGPCVATTTTTTTTTAKTTTIVVKDYCKTTTATSMLLSAKKSEFIISKTTTTTTTTTKSITRNVNPSEFKEESIKDNNKIRIKKLRLKCQANEPKFFEITKLND
jgi:hypothetical protein